MRRFQKILFAVAVFTLGFCIWYYTQMDHPPEAEAPVILSPIPAEAPVVAAKEFDVRDYGIEGEEADSMNAYFKEVKREVSDIISRDETLVVAMSDFKTEDDYKRKLYMALSMASRIKVILPAACDRLKKKFEQETNPELQAKIKRSQEYIVCVPAKW